LGGKAQKDQQMNNEQMLAALGMLPSPDIVTATKITDPLGAGAYYRADTVVRLLQNQWSPIETAPKDGTEILIFGEGEFAVAAWNGSEWRDIGDIGWGGMDGASPTHWKPLVPPNADVTGLAPREDDK
jgi:hypothetical protein